jgi:hypothetical protein
VSNPMMTPGGLALKAGTRLPDGWARPGFQVDAANRIVRPEDMPFRTVQGRSRHQHKEKAYAVSTSVGGQDATIVGAGVEWTEDLKDQARLLQEEARRFASQRDAAFEERAKAKMQAMKDHIDRRVRMFKRNPVTCPDPKHSISKERMYF